jgi:large conductance mechanosensitive channel
VPVFAYGNFVTTVINFFFLALAVFMIVKIVNKASKEKEAEPAATPEEILLLREIRDNLLTK